MNITIMPLSDDLALLPALDALLDQASVTRAADRCGLSQPAMSRALARLRHRFADPLLVREGGRWRLTPRAEQLRDPVRALLAQVALLDAAADFAPASAERVFRVAHERQQLDLGRAELLNGQFCGHGVHG